MNPLHAPFDPVTLATPFFILAVILEILLSKLGKATAYYEPRDTAVSLSLGLGSTVAGVLLASVIFAATVWVWEHRVFTIPMTAWWAWGADLSLGGLHLLLVPPAEPRAALLVGGACEPPFLDPLQPVDGAASDLDGRGERLVAVVAAAGVHGLSAGDDRHRERGQPRLPVLDPHRGDQEAAAPRSNSSSTRPRTTACTTPATLAISTATTPAS